MHSNKPDAQWSIRAEFTVVPQVPPPENTPASASKAPADQSGIRLSYSWKTDESTNASVARNAQQSTRGVDRVTRPVEYQKGSLTFTSNPPFRLPVPAVTPSASAAEIQDSGYGSDLFSLNSLAGESVRSPINSNNSRKCRSTCSIVLASANPEGDPSISGFGKCGRIGSLRCQTPTLQGLATIPRNTNFYGCGDPWCHHGNVGEDLPGRRSTCATLPRVSNRSPVPFSYHNLDLGYHKQQATYKRDVSIQTSDSLGKFSAASNETCGKKKRGKAPEKSEAKGWYSRGAQGQNYGQSSTSTRDSVEKIQTSTPKTTAAGKHSRDPGGHASDSSKKSRTIHIDVYCTDTEMEQSDSSSDSWESTSTPQTVFESESVNITHEKGRNTALPYRMRRYPRRDSSNATSLDRYDSDLDDESSVGYPSKIDSYSTINDLSSSISSLKSWKNYSLSSCANDQGSVDNFSRASVYSTDKPLLPKPASIGRKLPGHDACRKKSYDELCAIKNKHQALGSRIENVYLGQDYSKFAPRRLNPEGSDSIASIDVGTESVQNNRPAATVPDTTGLPKEKELPELPTSQAAFSHFLSQYTGRIASRFGEVISTSRKLGHHTGPAKNPDCACEHCKRYFASLGETKPE